jgi:hypothetical protein
MAAIAKAKPLIARFSNRVETEPIGGYGSRKARRQPEMQTVRVYDPERRPPNWRQIILPGQFVAFSTLAESGAPCDLEGTPFAAADDVTCLIFDSLPEAAAFCRARVEQAPIIRFEIFDATGRTQPPLLTVVHASRARTLEDNRIGRRMSYGAALALTVAAPILIWYDWARHDGLLMLPTIVGINCLLIAGRLVQLNLAYASAEKSRRARVAEHVDDETL